MFRKSDEYDADAIAMTGILYFESLPDAHPLDEYWSIQQLVHRRDTIMNQRVRLVNQLHEMIHRAYPYYKEFFKDISRPTALFFYYKFPSRKHLIDLSLNDIINSLNKTGHYSVLLNSVKKYINIHHQTHLVYVIIKIQVI